MSFSIRWTSRLAALVPKPRISGDRLGLKGKNGAACRADAGGCWYVSGIQGEFCAQTAKRRAMGGELPLDLSKKMVFIFPILSLARVSVKV
jgi:hypothetical protein